MVDVWNVVVGLKPAMLMVVLQITFAGVNVLYKIAVSDGMNLRVVIAYRFIFATAFIAPLALVLERNKRPKMTWSILFQASLCGLIGGAVSQNLYLESLALTSATFASAMANLTPAITFLMAVFFRLERFNLGTTAGKAKIIGTLIAISGAMILTFFKGININSGSIHITLLHHHNIHVASPQSYSNGNKALLVGTLCSLGSSFSYALWLIIQTKISKSYPCHYSSIALMSVIGSITSIAFALCLERDWTQWKLGWNVRLLTTAYSGIVVSGIMVVVMAWCVDIKGPLYVSAFNPLMLVFVALVGFSMLDEKLYLGSIIGGLLIVCGVYAVLWGKDKEINPIVPSRSLHEITVRSAAEEKRNPHNNHREVEFVRDYHHSSKNTSEVVRDI
ncbi:WAT1-related protein At1g25270-like [Prosopis cineraria]|uniref:WAT1-related protein At1g25270-like n=1 Tax=Prosopis cineraria TaxID=364024 RepID=UPI00240FD12F|nr:WAT1-related protein At1g25270-like [Prosopis cineraria]